MSDHKGMTDAFFGVLDSVAACIVVEMVNDDLAPLRRQLEGAGISVFSLRGPDLPTSPAFRGEVVSLLEFPDHYAQNWDAFAECLLESAEGWKSQGLVILVSQASALLADEEPRERETLASAIEFASSEWARAVLEPRALTLRIVLSNASGEVLPGWAQLPTIRIGHPD